MILKNGLVMTKDFEIKELDVQIEGGKIKNIGENLCGDEIVDIKGKYLLPGFIDTHIHGAYGARISDDNADLDKVTEYEKTQGVTSIAITTASSEWNSLLGQIDLAVKKSKEKNGTRIAGIHLEGPFLSKKFKGAMNENNIIAPDIKVFDELYDHGKGLIKIITIAPESENAEEFIKYAVSKGVTVAMGHTDSTYDDAIRGVKAGITSSTHTFNAMRPFNHRETGVLGAALTEESVSCEMICDFVHLHPSALMLIYKAKGADRIKMVSDSGHAAGWDVKEFVVDGLTRYVVDGVVRLANGTIAGSAKTMLDGFKNLLSMGIPLGEVSKMASINPAKALKMENEIGSIEVGKLADLVVMDKDYNVVSTYIDGECVYNA